MDYKDKIKYDHIVCLQDLRGEHQLKALKLLLVLGLIVTAIPLQFASAAGKKTIDHYIPMDVEDDYWASEEINDFINADVIDGYMDDEMNMTVKPDNKVTRAQFTKILVNALSLTMNGTPKTFNDVRRTDWYFEPVSIASSLGIISGKQDGSFAPNDSITRDQMTKMIVLAFEKTVQFPVGITQKFADVDKDYWAFEYVNKAAANEIVKGYGTAFKPRNLATRAQAIVMIYRGLQQEQSNLPNEEEVSNSLKDYILSENRLMEANDYEGLNTLYNGHGMGYYLAQAMELNGVDQGYKVGIDDENLSLDVLAVSNRYITIEVTGIVGRFTYNSDDFNMDFTSKMEGIYHLKRRSSSEWWKIYDYLPYFEE